MKHIKSILTIALFAFVISLLSSCGGPKYADTDQIKSWIFYESVADNILIDISKEYIDKLKDNAITGVNIPDASIEICGLKDTYNINPWIFSTAKSIPVSVELWGVYLHLIWNTNQDEILNLYLDNWDSTYGNYTRYSSGKQYLYLFFGSDCSNSIEFEEINKYIQSKPEENARLRLATGKGFINYFNTKANEYVTVKDWEYDNDATTKSCTGYYVTYEIGEGFYVLANLIEEDSSTKFQIEILYSGDSMIELEQTLSLYKD